MSSKKKIAQLLAVFCTALLIAFAAFEVRAQQAPAGQNPPQPPGGLGAGAAAGAPGAPGAPGAAGAGRGFGTGGGRGPQGRPASSTNGVQNQTPWPWDVTAMEDALPDKAYATPKSPRKILVLCKASGFVHSSIPIAAATIKEMGDKTGAWTTTITYDPADITADNLKQYDLVFLDSTTGEFLNDPNEEITNERKQALLNFVQGGKGLAGIHAAVDSYHTSGFGGGRGRGAAAGAPGAPGAPGAAPAAAAAPPAAAPAMAAAAPAEGATAPSGTWPDFNQMVGGFFKFHWTYPQLITVKIDDPKSPLTQMFHGQEFTIHDETYTLLQDSNSSWKNIHVLTSIDYSKMSDADKAKEPAATRRTDGDYALSYIRREGKGRVFIELHGHDEHVYQMTPMLEHILAGTQYALGDLKADDAPTMK
jgi:type 1 glutamine amidotransferase